MDIISLDHNKVQIDDFIIPLHKVLSIETSWLPESHIRSYQDKIARKLAIQRRYIPNDVHKYAIFRGTAEHPDSFVFMDVEYKNITGLISFSELDLPQYKHTRLAEIISNTPFKTLFPKSQQTKHDQLSEQGIDLNYRWSQKSLDICVTDQYMFNVYF